MCAKIIDKKEKKDQIIQAALQVFTKKGFAKTTINDIAHAAGIGKGTVYEYFAHKEEIINHSFHYFMHAMELDFQEILILEIPAKEKFIGILEGFSQFLSPENMQLMELMLDFWAEGIKTKHSEGFLADEMRKFYHSYREIFADIIIEGMQDGSFKKDVNPRSTASMIIGALDGVMVQWILDKTSIDFHDMIRTVTATVLNGIAAESN